MVVSFAVLTVGDWIVVGIPVVLAVLGIAMTFFPPQSGIPKLIWVIGFASLGVIYVIVALGQISGARRDQQQAFNTAKADSAKLDSLSAQVKQLSQGQFQVIVKQATAQTDQQRESSLPPDLALIFSDPSSVVVTVLNKSKSVANEPAYYVALWDIDSSPGLLLQPLQIPAQTGAFVRSGEGWGPNMMMGLPAVSARVKQGDRIFGFASVTCPECRLRRYYWLYIKQGYGGWYSETKPVNLQAMGRSIPAIAHEPDSTLSRLVPVQKRTPIRALN